MQNLEARDRRIFERMPVEFPLKYLDLNADKEAEAQTINLSAAGMELTTNKELLRHTPIDIWLIIPDNGEPFYTKGEVIWSNRAEANRYRVGIKLKEVDFMGLSRVSRIVYRRKNI